jgi:small-conductance mechanosensitive channel
VRTSILLWSAFSGVVVGIIADVALIGAVLLLSFVAPPAVDRLMHARWALTIAGCVLALVLVAAAVLGYLEGDLKTV